MRIDDFVSDKIRRSLSDKLSSLSYVKIISGDNFDLMIDGKISDGKYKARLLNKIGDTFSIPASSNLEGLASNIKSRLDYAFMFKQLLALRHTSPHFKVHLKPALDSGRRDYFIGEEIIFDLETENDGYLLLINLDIDGNLHFLFPNKYYSKNFIRANQKIQIPNEEMRKNDFVFNFGPPAGQEVVKAIFTRTPIKLDKFNLEESARQFDDMGRITVPRQKRVDFLKALWDMVASSQTDWSEDILVLRNYEK